MCNSKTLLLVVVDGPVFPGSDISITSREGQPHKVLFHAAYEVLNQDLKNCKDGKALMDTHLIPEMWPIANALKESW